ncbi:hypothetical protein BpHYR1_039241 [Brachionus plicatilis]|uniref:Uncharacterized protein n=1 Tax=Brachionus plicatilis TaxID=10195 RepID=A0A3M7QUY5_BRAPC|nr:hypothetical protein BpHYR1_039241 [Brachionus plicatilis]
MITKLSRILSSSNSLKKDSTKVAFVFTLTKFLLTIDICVFYINKCHLSMLNYWIQVALVLLFKQKLHKSFYDIHFNIAPVIPRYQHLKNRSENFIL